MIVKIHQSKISGRIQAPASKSSMQRACALALLLSGETIISNPGTSNDDFAALDIIQRLGAKVTKTGSDLTIISNGIHPLSSEINCGESGLGLRMFAPLVALSSKAITLNGQGSLLQRPMNFFDEIFPLLKINIESNNGKLPIKIKGPLHPTDIFIDGSLSSQFLTGLLMAFAIACTKTVTIKVTNLKSKPYVNLTLTMMKNFGLSIESRNYDEFIFCPTILPKLQTIRYTVEGDWSGAAFLLVAGAIAGNISVEGLDINSVQADKKILDALKLCGAKLLINKDEITILSSSLNAFHFDATDCPDLFPPLVALAAYCNGSSEIKGTSRLAHKESNRAITLQEEFKKMGIEIKLRNDVMRIEGGKVKGARVQSHHDHRIAMACAVAALRAEGETIISDAEAINKSYPEFYEHLQKLNAHLQKT